MAKRRSGRSIGSSPSKIAHTRAWGIMATQESASSIARNGQGPRQECHALASLHNTNHMHPSLTTGAPSKPVPRFQNSTETSWTASRPIREYQKGGNNASGPVPRSTRWCIAHLQRQLMIKELPKEVLLSLSRSHSKTWGIGSITVGGLNPSCDPTCNIDDFWRREDEGCVRQLLLFDGASSEFQPIVSWGRLAAENLP